MKKETTFSQRVGCLFYVDLEGIEPSSKRIVNELSTRLASYWIVGDVLGRKQP